MKKHLLTVGLLALPWLAPAQNDAANLRKYWNLRHDLRERYTKIGSETGESLPAKSFHPLFCIDTHTQYGGHSSGEMHWGDGMIYHGYYLGLLATEYRLQKDRGQDVTAVLNELAFALNAINRVDLRAESDLGTDVYSVNFDASLNGFYLREDVGEDFCLHWQYEDFEARCTNSAFYWNNNSAKLHNPANDYIARGNSYQNTPSLDQLTALMVGFSLVHKLVDNVYVQPPGAGFGMYIKTENAAIVDRIIRYISERNWFMIDVNGWPVNNGGGDCLFSAYPLLEAAERITGNTNYTENWRRRAIPYRLMQHCITGKGVESEAANKQEAACNKNDHLPALLFSAGAQGAAAAYTQAWEFLSNNPDPGDDNNQDESRFMSWQENGAFWGTTNFTYGVWTDYLPNTFPDDVTVPLWDVMFQFFNPQERYYELVYETVGGNDVKPWVQDYNLTIMYNLGVISGKWNSSQCHKWGNITENRANELTNAVLYNKTPSHPRSFYTSYLSSMPEGAHPYYFKASQKNNPVSYARNQLNGWASPYRWTHPNSAELGDGGNQGIFNGLDYMLFYNLVQLAFPQQGVFNTLDYTCDCAEIVPQSTQNMSGFQLEACISLNNKVAYASTCSINALDPVNNVVLGNFTVGPVFPEYASYGIKSPKYQRTNASIQHDSKLVVNTRLVFCGYVDLNIEQGGELVIEPNGELILHDYFHHIENKGVIRVKNGGKLILDEFSSLTLQNGAQLILEEGAMVELKTGSLTYKNGASIVNLGVSTLHLNGGEIILPDANTNFTIDNFGSSQSLHLQVSNHSYLKAANNSCTFDFQGMYNGEQFIDLMAGAILDVQKTNSAFTDAKILMNDMGIRFNEDSELQLKIRVLANDVLFQSFDLDKGLVVLNDNLFHNCTFNDVPLSAPLNIENEAGLTLDQCTFTANLINPSYPALVKVTGQQLVAQSCAFSTKKGGCIQTMDCIYPSSINFCQFTGTQTGSMIPPSGIGDASTVEVKVNNCTFSNLYTGIAKQYGKLTSRCNTFSLPKYATINMQNGILNLSGTSGAGYNEFNIPTLDNATISFTNATLQLENGYNKFASLYNANQRYLAGTVTQACGSACTYSINKNQWTASTSVIPPTSAFDIYSSNGPEMTAITSPNQAFPQCGAFDPPVIIPGDRSTAHDPEVEHVNTQTIDSDPESLENAIYYGLSEMTLYNVRGNDLHAIEIFAGIIKDNYKAEDRATFPLLLQACNLMKSALECAYAQNVLVARDNHGSFEPYTQLYVEVLNLLTPATVTDDNRAQAFISELNKVHLFRVLKKSQMAFDLLSELEACELRAVEQSMLNYWKQQIWKDISQQKAGYAALDSGFSAVPLKMKQVAENAMSNRLSTILILNPDQVIVHDCRDAGSTNPTDAELLLVKPNPTNDAFSFRLNMNNYGNYIDILLQSLDGRSVYQSAFTGMEEQVVTVPVIHLASGTYILTICGSNNHRTSTTVVVQ